VVYNIDSKFSPPSKSCRNLFETQSAQETVDTSRIHQTDWSPTHQNSCTCSIFRSFTLHIGASISLIIRAANNYCLQENDIQNESACNTLSTCAHFMLYMCWCNISVLVVLCILYFEMDQKSGLTNWLPPLSGLLLESLIVAQLVKNSPLLWNLRVHYLVDRSPSVDHPWTRWIQSTTLYTICLTSIRIFLFLSSPMSSEWSPPFRYSDQNFVYIYMYIP
jgi:hypothetical protein